MGNIEFFCRMCAVLFQDSSTNITKNSISLSGCGNFKQILCQTGLEAVVPEAAALLESKEVSQSSCIGLDSETPGLPLSVWNP